MLHVAELNHTQEFMDLKFNYLSYFLFAHFLLSLANLIFPHSNEAVRENQIIASFESEQ